MKNLSLIVCVNLDYAIGSKLTNEKFPNNCLEISCENHLLYKISPDLKRFKQLTTGKTIVMGMNTFKSLGCKPLPNRKNFVFTQNPEISKQLIEIENVEFSSFDYPLEDGLKELFLKQTEPEEIFVIGGAQIYTQTLPFVDKMYITMVYDRIVPKESLIYFPKINFSEWNIIENSEIYWDQKSDKKYSFTTYARKPIYKNYLDWWNKMNLEEKFYKTIKHNSLISGDNTRHPNTLTENEIEIIFKAELN